MSQSQQKPHRVLLIEDDSALQRALRDRLQGEGYEVDCVDDGLEGESRASSEAYDLILLDVMLPGKDGFDVARELRIKGVDTPILMLTARGEVTDKVVGLQLGADDYLTKPFEFIELLARMRALLRRSEGAVSRRPSATFSFGNVSVSFDNAEVLRDGEPVHLSARELRLLRHFIEHPGIVLSRDELLDAVWGYDAMPTTRTVDVHVARLRQKIENNPSHPQHIITVIGLGYKFVA
jgi:two-component system alkaline phosphatase synthesis response regulator PhoP